MRKKYQLPRLTRRDIERILDVHQQLNVVRDSLMHCNWPGGRACAGGILAALVMCSELYNRAEQAFLEGADPSTAPSLENGPAGPFVAPGEDLEVQMTTVVHKQE